MKTREALRCSRCKRIQNVSSMPRGAHLTLILRVYRARAADKDAVKWGMCNVFYVAKRRATEMMHVSYQYAARSSLLQLILTNFDMQKHFEVADIVTK